MLSLPISKKIAAACSKHAIASAENPIPKPTISLDWPMFKATISYKWKWKFSGNARA